MSEVQQPGTWLELGGQGGGPESHQPGSVLWAGEDVGLYAGCHRALEGFFGFLSYFYMYQFSHLYHYEHYFTLWLTIQYHFILLLRLF